MIRIYMREEKHNKLEIYIFVNMFYSNHLLDLLTIKSNTEENKHLYETH